MGKEKAMEQGIISIYYNIKDELEIQELLKHLRLVHPPNSFDLYPGNQDGWDLSAPEPGTAPHIVLLIITANFLNSTTAKNYMPALVTRWHRNGRVIFPIIAKACAWDTIPWLHHLFVWPNDGQPIWLSANSRNDESLAQVVYEIARAKRKITHKTINVIVADDHIHAVEGLRAIIEKTVDMHVIAIAETKLQVLNLVRTHLPEVLVLDLAWPGDKEFGLKLIPQIKRYSPSTRIVAITNYPELVEEAQQIGAFPLQKGFSKHLLLETIRWALNDHTPKPNRSSQPTHNLDSNIQPDNLTNREKDVLELIVEGLTDQQIALELHIAKGTVKKHVSNILSKLGVNSRTEAAVISERFNLLS